MSSSKRYLWAQWRKMQWKTRCVLRLLWQTRSVGKRYCHDALFDAYPNLSDEQVYGLDLLLDLSDDELFALIMGRKELKDVDPAGHMMDENDMRQADEVLALLRVV